MSIRIHNPYPLAIFLALLVASGAAYYKFVISVVPAPEREIPKIGAPGSTHAHASLLVMVGDRMINFCDPKYMLKSPIVHFEDNNCFTIHKHATGITLQTFLDTIGVELKPGCITLPQDKTTAYCDEGVKQVRVIYNGVDVPIAELAYREFQNNDHILINYGAEDDVKLRFKYNQVPNIPADVNEPLLNEDQ